jgi:hypothetical protein
MRAAVVSMFLAFVGAASAQTLVTGVVVDANQEPVVGAVVKALANGKIKAFANSNKEGKFTLKIPTTVVDDSLTVTAEGVSYAKLSERIANREQQLKFVLSASATTLKEFTKVANAIEVQGDTMTYQLSAFTSEGDRTLEDGLKKLPGVSVDANGAISYQGRKVSKFYIDGLDLLNGKYTIATRNIPKEYVSQIQLLSHFNEAKMDKGKPSNNVAINVKLSEGAKFKPVGTTEAAIGYGDKLLYKLGVAGMLFKPNFQSIITAKAGNISRFSDSETGTMVLNADFADEAPLAERAAGRLSASTPPMREVRYLEADDRMVSVNTVQKIKGDNKTLNVNADYANTVTEYDLSQNTSYYAGGDKEISFFERESPHSNMHKPSLMLKYKDNADMHYITETFQAKGEFVNTDFDTETTDGSYLQSQRTRQFSVKNDFSIRFRTKNRRSWSIDSRIEYLSAPKYDLSVADRNENTSVTQEVGSDKLLVTLNGQAGYVSKGWQLFLALNSDYERNTVTSDLLGADKESANSYVSNLGRVRLIPTIQYFSSDRRLSLQIKLMPTARFFSARNRLTDDKTDDNRLQFQFMSWLSYSLNSFWQMTANANYNQNVGDVVNLLTSPIKRTYRTENANSGIISSNDVMLGRLYFNYKNPVKMWFANGGVEYTRSSMNTLASQYVSTDNVAMQALAGDNTSENVSTSLSVTKQFMPIHSQISMSASYSYSRNTIMQQNVVMNYYGNSYTLIPSVSLHPWSVVELKYSCSYSKTFTRYVGNSYSRDFLNNNVDLKIYPVKNVIINGTGEFIKRQISEDARKSISIFDVGVTYKIKKMDIRADLRNILNTRSYSYSLYNGIDAYTYDFGLRGREFTVTLIYRR